MGAWTWRSAPDAVDPERINEFELGRDQLSLNAWSNVANASQPGLPVHRVLRDGAATADTKHVRRNRRGFYSQIR